MYAQSIEKLIESFEKLPSIGRKTAERLAFYMLEAEKSEVMDFVNSLIEAKNNLKECSICFNISDSNPCHICKDSFRDNKTICVVEDVKDIVAMEKTHEYKGVYHVLHGAISPMNNITADDIKIKELLQRIKKEKIEEVIIATNPKVEGEATAMYISKLLSPFDIKITRIASGVPIGGDLEYIDEITLSKALKGRIDIKEE